MKRPAKTKSTRNLLPPVKQDSRLYRRGFFAGLIPMTLLFFTTCQGPFTLENALGLMMEELVVSPSNIVIDPSTTQLLTVSGGTGPYSWEIYAGPGTFISSADVTSVTATGSETYDPGGTEGIATIRVTDIEGKTGQAIITLVIGGTGPVDPLQILAGASVIDVNEELIFFAAGGIPPYTYDLITNGTGSSSVSGNTYRAGSTAGTDVVRVRDSNSPVSEKTATITVNTVATITPDIDYEFTTVTLNSPASIGEAISADFIYSNLGDNNGTDNIEWNAYWSVNTSFSGIVTHAASGNLSPLNGLSPSLSMSIGGNWPSVSGSYYLILHLGTSVDNNATNNIWVSAVQSLNVDYQVPVPPAGSTVKAGDPINVTFQIENQGDVNGSGSYTWTAYMSDNGALGAGDTEIQSNSAGTALDVGASADIIINGSTWPIVDITTNRNIILEWYSTDDPDTVRTSVSGTFSVEPIDVNYQSVAPTPGGATYFTGSPISGELFHLENTGDDDGSLPGTWTAYLSANAALNKVSDTVVSAGTFPALLRNNTETTTITVSGGTWPLTAAPAYLILEWMADDDLTAPKTAVSSAYTIAERNVVYSGSWATPPVLNTAGGIYALDFTLTNTGPDIGTIAGTYTAYLSDNTTLSLDDTPIVTSTFGPLDNGNSQVIPVTGILPENDINRYLIMEWSAEEDGGSPKELSSTIFDVSYPDADYQISAASLLISSGEIYTGGSLDAEVSFVNLGTQDALASDLWDWEVYLSSNNLPSIDSGDILIASGTDETALTASPAAGSSLSFNALSADWPLEEGDYYLKGRVSAPHDWNAGNDIAVSTAYPISNGSDFTITNFSVPPTNGYRQDFTSLSLTIRDNNGRNNSEPVYSEIYASADSSLDPAEDILLFQKSLATPPSGAATGTISFTSADQIDFYPYAGEAYLFATITSATDNAPGNNIVHNSLDIIEGNATFIDFVPNGYSEPILIDSAVDTFYSGGFVPVPENSSTMVTEIHRIDLGETVIVTGATDGGNTEIDTYHFETGPGVGKIQAQMIWASGEDYDFYLWNGEGTETTIGGDAHPANEPDDLGFVWALTVSANSDGFISVYDPLNGASPPGASYVLYLTGTSP